MSYGRDDFIRDLASAGIAITPNQADALDTYRALLAEWSARINLIGPSELEHFWKRHALDCAQLLVHARHAARWLDLGAGAGLPGLIIAIALNGAPDAEVRLVESITKKARFLNAVIDALGLPARVYNLRIEDYWAAETAGAGADAPPDIVTARALAPLNRLTLYAKPALLRGAQGLFHKGANFDAELKAAAAALKGGGPKETLQAEVMDSLSDPRGRIVRVSLVRPAPPPI